MLRAFLEVNMGWQERIERYKQEKEVRLKRAEKEAKRQREEVFEAKKPEMLRIVREKIPSLLGVLRELNCETLLTQLRDEVWRIGTVSMKPDLNNLTYDTPIGAGVILSTEYPVYIQEGKDLMPGSVDSFWVRDPEKDYIGYKHEILSISAVYGEESRDGIVYSRSCQNILLVVTDRELPFPHAEDENYRFHEFGKGWVGYNNSVPIIDTTLRGETLQFLENALIEYCVKREPEEFVEKRRSYVRKLIEESRFNPTFREKYGGQLKEIARENGVHFPFFYPFAF